MLPTTSEELSAYGADLSNNLSKFAIQVQKLIQQFRIATQKIKNIIEEIEPVSPDSIQESGLLSRQWSVVYPLADALMKESVTLANKEESLTNQAETSKNLIAQLTDVVGKIEDVHSTLIVERMVGNDITDLDDELLGYELKFPSLTLNLVASIKKSIELHMTQLQKNLLEKQNNVEKINDLTIAKTTESEVTSTEQNFNNLKEKVEYEEKNQETKEITETSLEKTFNELKEATEISIEQNGHGLVKDKEANSFNTIDTKESSENSIESDINISKVKTKENFKETANHNRFESQMLDAPNERGEGMPLGQQKFVSLPQLEKPKPTLDQLSRVRNISNNVQKIKNNIETISGQSSVTTSKNDLTANVPVAKVNEKISFFEKKMLQKPAAPEPEQPVVEDKKPKPKSQFIMNMADMVSNSPAFQHKSFLKVPISPVRTKNEEETSNEKIEVATVEQNQSDKMNDDDKRVEQGNEEIAKSAALSNEVAVNEKQEKNAHLKMELEKLINELKFTEDFKESNQTKSKEKLDAQKAQKSTESLNSSKKESGVKSSSKSFENLKTDSSNTSKKEIGVKSASKSFENLKNHGMNINHLQNGKIQLEELKDQNSSEYSKMKSDGALDEQGNVQSLFSLSTAESQPFSERKKSLPAPEYLLQALNEQFPTNGVAASEVSLNPLHEHRRQSQERRQSEQNRTSEQRSNRLFSEEFASNKSIKEKKKKKQDPFFDNYKPPSLEEDEALLNSLPVVSYPEILLQPLNGLNLLPGATPSKPYVRLNLSKNCRIGRSNIQKHPNFFAISTSQVVSRNHFELWESQGEFFIADVGSHSGTWLNGHRLSDPGVASSQYQIRSGDLLRIGADFKQNKESQEEVKEPRYKGIYVRVLVRYPIELSQYSEIEETTTRSINIAGAVTGQKDIQEKKALLQSQLQEQKLKEQLQEAVGPFQKDSIGPTAVNSAAAYYSENIARMNLSRYFFCMTSSTLPYKIKKISIHNPSNLMDPRPLGTDLEKSVIDLIGPEIISVSMKHWSPGNKQKIVLHDLRLPNPSSNSELGHEDRGLAIEIVRDEIYSGLYNIILIMGQAMSQATSPEDKPISLLRNAAGGSNPLLRLSHPELPKMSAYKLGVIDQTSTLKCKISLCFVPLTNYGTSTILKAPGPTRVSSTTPFAFVNDRDTRRMETHLPLTKYGMIIDSPAIIDTLPALSVVGEFSQSSPQSRFSFTNANTEFKLDPSLLQSKAQPALSPTDDQFDTGKVLCVLKRPPPSRLQKLVGEVRGRQLMKKSVRETKWIIGLEVLEEVLWLEMDQMAKATGGLEWAEFERNGMDEHTKWLYRKEWWSLVLLATLIYGYVKD